MGLDALIRCLRSLPWGVAVQTLFRSLTHRIPGAMETVLVAGQVTAKEAAKAIALKHRLASLTADPVIIPDSFGVVAKHMDEKMATWPDCFCASSSLCCRYTRRHDV